jgi:hypothetical protein
VALISVSLHQIKKEVCRANLFFTLFYRYIFDLFRSFYKLFCVLHFRYAYVTMIIIFYCVPAHFAAFIARFS